MLGTMDLNKHIARAYAKGSGTSKDQGLVMRTDEPRPTPKAPPTPTKEPAATKGKPGRSEIARYLILIGPEEAGKVLAHLGADEVEALAREIAAIESIGPDEAKAVLARFQGLVRSTWDGPLVGGAGVAKGMLTAAFGEERGKQLFHQALPEEEQPFFSFLMDLDPVQISALLKTESSAVKSIVLAYLPPPTAASILKSSSRDEQKDIIVRMASMKRIDRDVLQRIDTALRERFREVATVVKDEMDGRTSLANIMRHLDPSMEQGLLDELALEVPDLAEEIRDRLFTMDTVPLVDDRDLQKVLAELDDRRIAMLLKGQTDLVRNKILNNLSGSRGRQVAEEYQLLGPQKRKDVDEITRDFILELKNRELGGTLRVLREDEDYV